VVVLVDDLPSADAASDGCLGVGHADVAAEVTFDELVAGVRPLG
jgi:hypothetical protein